MLPSHLIPICLACATAFKLKSKKKKKYTHYYNISTPPSCFSQRDIYITEDCKNVFVGDDWWTCKGYQEYLNLKFNYPNADSEALAVMLLSKYAPYCMVYYPLSNLYAYKTENQYLNAVKNFENQFPQISALMADLIQQFENIK